MESQSDTMTRVEASDLEEGDKVTVFVNSRARSHLGTSSFEAVVDGICGPDIRFKRDGADNTNTWYSDTGYIHGHHEGLGRYSDIGKVQKIER